MIIVVMLLVTNYRFKLQTLGLTPLFKIDAYVITKHDVTQQLLFWRKWTPTNSLLTD